MTEPAFDDARGARSMSEAEVAAGANRECDRDELIMSLERDQFVAETSRPLPRATLTPHMVIALWALRIFVTVVSLMVIYTFVDQLH